VQDNTEEGIVDLDLAVVLNEANFLNLFMKKLTRDRVVPSSPQHLLRYFGKSLVRSRRAIARQQQQSARQPFLAGVEELVYQSARLDVSRKHISDEAVGNSCSSWSARIISSLSMTSTLVGECDRGHQVIGLPARHLPQENRPAKDCTTASLPVLFTTVSFAPPS